MVLVPATVTGSIATAPAGHDPPGRGSHTRFGNHCTPLPVVAAVGEMTIGMPMSGRKVPSPVSELAFAASAPPVIAPTFPANSVTGLPLCDCTIAESCQPPSALFFLNGNSYSPLKTKRWRASKSERPRSPRTLLLSCRVTPCELCEFSSIDFEKVYEALNCRPRDSRLLAVTHNAL